MDLDEWELLPRDGFLDYHEDGEKKYVASNKRSSNTNTLFDMNYFMCPSSPPRKLRGVPNQVVPLTIQLEPITTPTAAPTPSLAAKGCSKEEQEYGMSREVTKVPIDMTVVVPSLIMPKVKDPDYVGSRDQEADQDSVSQVFFKKLKESEFVDMKLDSPKSPTRIFLPPQIDAASFNFEDNSEALEAAKIPSPRIKNMENESAKHQQVIWEENSGAANLWKWSLTGIGAICSFGVAAATICILIFGSHQKSMKQQENQKLRFQIYSDDKASPTSNHCSSHI
ncbi:hypothetical protein Tsubulata_018150 [Turnera subulata]|uniref:DUF6821 domain-containing protein n=1 Tax=Turnera subulata TaxID=218843 RepID=A0A9Q0F2J2_9ROSI|nr:hypothetical protein Tsubulata_018150 [Turnera subulata]